MNEWEIAAAVIAVAVLPCLGICVLAPAVADALVALELAGTLAATALMLLCEGLHRQPFMDLALLFALLSMLGAFVFARMMERAL